MTVQYKVDFDQLDWEVPFEGIRHKYLDQGNLRVRLVEYSKEVPPHWCEKAHYGYLIDGQFKIEYEKSAIIYNPGDGIYIPPGPAHKHRATAITDTVRVFFIEDL